MPLSRYFKKRPQGWKEHSKRINRKVREEADVIGGA
jgi:hypothetical protein